jgi:hypothetical protein
MTESKDKFEEMPEDKINQIEFMAKRLGYDNYIIAGYDKAEFEKHILSQGLYEDGGPEIALNASIAGAAFIIARLFCDFPWSVELRRAVHSIVNTVETGREIDKNVKKQGD